MEILSSKTHLPVFKTLPVTSIMKSYKLYISLFFLVLSFTTTQVLKAFTDPTNNDESLLASYALDGDSMDDSGSKNHAVLKGPIGTTNRFGEMNKALEFSGDDYVTVFDDSKLNVRKGVSISAWINPEPNDDKVEKFWWDKMWIVGKNRDITSGYHLFISENFELQGWALGARNSSITKFQLPSGTGGEWNHCMLTYDQFLGGVLYYNGKIVDESDPVGPLVCHNEEEGFSIGRHSMFNLYHFHGKIDDVKIFNYALDESEAISIYHAESKAPPPNRVPDLNAPDGLVDYKTMLDEARAKEEKLQKLFNQKNTSKNFLVESVASLKNEKMKIEQSILSLSLELKYCEEDKTANSFKLEKLTKERKASEDKTYALKESIGQIQLKIQELTQFKQEQLAVQKDLNDNLVEKEKMLATAHLPNWHYLPDYGWLWTSPEYYPLIYSSQRAGWLYYEQGTAEPWAYFDYNKGQWEEWFSPVPLFSIDN
jgi:hypothetical protein